MAEQAKSGELLLVWKHPRTRVRYLIGRIWHEEGGYRFAYERAAPRSVEHAVEQGFRLLDEFPSIATIYSARALYPSFSRRVRKTTKLLPFAQTEAAFPDAAEFECLRRTGGRVPTDGFEFLEPCRVQDDQYAVSFPIAGFRYYDGELAIARGEIAIGTPLVLELDPENKFDQSAIRVLSPASTRLGYVPSIYSWYLDEIVKHGDYKATVEGIGAREDPQLRVQVGFRGTSKFDAQLLPSGIDAYVKAIEAR